MKQTRNDNIGFRFINIVISYYRDLVNVVNV